MARTSGAVEVVNNIKISEEGRQRAAGNLSGTARRAQVKELTREIASWAWQSARRFRGDATIQSDGACALITSFLPYIPSFRRTRNTYHGWFTGRAGSPT